MAVCIKTLLTLRAGQQLPPRVLINTAFPSLTITRSTNLPEKPRCFYSGPPVSLIAKRKNEAKTCGPLAKSGAVSFPVSTPLSLLTCRTYAKKGKDKGGKAHKKVVLTDDQLDGLLDMGKVEGELDHVVEDLKDKFIHQITVRTSQGAFDNLLVKTPDGSFPLIQLGQVLQKSPQLLTINLTSSPQYIAHVKEALLGSGLNINPQQEGTSLFIPLPKVTREHRENLAKNAKMLSEKSKKHLREVYSKYSRKIKSAKSGHSSDDVIAADDMVQDLMHAKMKLVDEMTSAKQKEILGGK